MNIRVLSIIFLFLPFSAFAQSAGSGQPAQVIVCQDSSSASASVAPCSADAQTGEQMVPSVTQAYLVDEPGWNSVVAGENTITSADYATAFSWGFALVMASYCLGWAVGAVLRVIRFSV